MDYIAMIACGIGYALFTVLFLVGFVRYNKVILLALSVSTLFFACFMLEANQAFKLFAPNSIFFGIPFLYAGVGWLIASVDFWLDSKRLEGFYSYISFGLSTAFSFLGLLSTVIFFVGVGQRY